MTNNHPDQIDAEIDEILRKYAAYCDQYNREVEYDTSDNIDDDQAHAAVKVLVLKERLEETKQIFSILWDEDGSPFQRDDPPREILDRISNLEKEIEVMQG